MMTFSFNSSSLWVIAGGVVILAGLIWAIFSIMDKGEIKEALETQAREMSVGQLAALIILAGVFF